MRGSLSSRSAGSLFRKRLQTCADGSFARRQGPARRQARLRSKSSEAQVWPMSWMRSSFERELHAGDKGARRPGIDRARGVRQYARRILNARSGDAVRDVVGGCDIGLVEDIAHLDEHRELPETVRHQVCLVVQVEVDDLIAGCF